MDKEWWIKLAEEVLGRKIEGHEIKFEFEPLKLEEGEDILISDITEEYEYLFGLRLATAGIWQVLKTEIKNLPIGRC